MGKRIAWIAGCVALLVLNPARDPFARASIRMSEPAAKLVSLQIDPSEATIHGDGEMLQFTALGGYSDGSFQPVTEKAMWDSSDRNIVMVSSEAGSQGRAISVSFGSVAITARFEGLKASAMLTVSPIWCLRTP